MWLHPAGALELPGFRGPIPVADAVKAAEFAGELARLVVEIPPLGFAWVPRTDRQHAAAESRMKLADGLTVRNEFLECDIDSQTGGIRSFRDMRTRLTRFGHQLVFNPGSRMIARDIAVTNAGTARSGRLPAAATSSTITTACSPLSGSVSAPGSAGRARDPHRVRSATRTDRLSLASFYARGSAGAATTGPCCFAALRATTRRPATPGRSRPTTWRSGSPRSRSFLFTGGSAVHLRRHGSRMADVILIPEGERARSFELLLATDRDVPMQTAMGWTSPTPVVETTKGPPHFGSTGWLAHVDMPSLILTALQPAAAGENANAPFRRDSSRRRASEGRRRSASRAIPSAPP